MRRTDAPRQRTGVNGSQAGSFRLRFDIGFTLDTSRVRGEMQAESPVRRAAAPAFVGSEALAEGLMLVRASTLKVIRLQLAMERRDRRVALEAVDELVALDRRLERYLADVPAPELEVERAALNREKLTLAAEVIRSEPKPVEAVPEPAPEPAWEDHAVEEERPSRATWWLAAALLVLAALAGLAYGYAGAWA